MDKSDIIFLNILRFFFVLFVYFFLLDGIQINSGDIEILYISPYMFRFVLMGTLLYYLLEFFVPYLFKKLLKFITFLFSNGGEND